MLQLLLEFQKTKNFCVIWQKLAHKNTILPKKCNLYPNQQQGILNKILFTAILIINAVFLKNTHIYRKTSAGAIVANFPMNLRPVLTITV